MIFTLVEPTLRLVMRELCEDAGVDYCDLLAEPLAAVAKVSGQPRRDAAARAAGARRGLLQADRRDRVRGQERRRPRARASPQADVVLVGVSRTSKTPLSIYLGYLGWKATNVPLVKGIEPPQELFEIDPARIVGLTIDANRLAEIRSERLVLMGGDRRYADLNEVYEDLEHAAAIHKRLGCPVIDVSELSIEEIALRIVQTVEGRLRREDPREAEAAGAEVALGALDARCSARRSSSSTASSRRSGSRCARWRGSRSSARAGSGSLWPPRGNNHAMTGDAALRLRLRRVRARRPRAARRQGHRPRRDDGARAARPVRASRSRPTPAAPTWPRASCRRASPTEVAEHVSPARGEDRQALRRPLRPAARLRPLGRRDLDAGDDGHDPQPRPQRRGGRGPRRAHRQPRASPTTPTGA